MRMSHRMFTPQPTRQMQLSCAASTFARKSAMLARTMKIVHQVTEAAKSARFEARKQRKQDPPDARMQIRRKACVVPTSKPTPASRAESTRPAHTPSPATRIRDQQRIRRPDQQHQHAS